LELSYRFALDVAAARIMRERKEYDLASQFWRSGTSIGANVALFGQTAKQWRDAHPDAEGNIRDSFLQTLRAMKTNTICPVDPIRAQTSGLAAA
jgi:hypothetical protein